MTDFDSRLLRSFVAVAEERRIGRAAERLYITPSALSKHVRRLERQLGEPLLTRSPEGVALTRAGERLLPLARATLASFEAFVGAGPLRVPGGRAFGPPPRLLVRLREAVGPIEVVPDPLPHDRTLDALLDGELSVGWTQLDRAPDLRLEHELVRLEPVVLLLEAHALARRLTRVVTLRSDPDRLSAWVGFARQYATAVGVQLGAVVPRGVPVQSLLAAGALSPAALAVGSAFDAVSAREGTVCLPVPLQPYCPWSLVWRRSEREDPRIVAVRRVAQELAAQEGWLQADPALPGRPWLPDRGLHADRLEGLRRRWEAGRTTVALDARPQVRLEGHGAPPVGDGA